MSNCTSLQEQQPCAMGTLPQGTVCSNNRSRMAIILGNFQNPHDQITAPLMRVGTLPVVLRTILGLGKAGVSRIVVCVDPANGPNISAQLKDTGRLPESVEWLETTSETDPVRQVFLYHPLEAEQGHVLVLSGDTIYHPALLRELVSWDADGESLVLTCNGDPIGAWALSLEATAKINKQDGCMRPPGADVLRLSSTQHKEVGQDQWQQVVTAHDRIRAERNLDGWLVKPTDGIFARFNRRISIPMSRQMIKWPISPNMISLFTLGVGLVSGVFFAFGGYWNTVFAAVLSLWASILDGCDGEVARIRLMESDFGCWLETICDYLYYLFIFSGMAIGLVRTIGPEFLFWSGLLVFGAIMTFVLAGMGRRRLARGRPEQYLAIWQAQAESRRTNPILYFARHTEFILRRCFLPYAILAFALLGLTNVVLIASAIGANCAWIISLYSYRRFSRPPAASPKPCTAPF